MENNANEGFGLYEVGFHIAPLIAEENLLAEVSKIKSAIEQAGGIFVGEEFPKLRSLAYNLSKKIGTTKHTFDKAYFGAIKFNAAGEGAQNLKKALDLNENIVRYILVHAVKDEPVTFSKLTHTKTSHTEGENQADAKPVSTEELDKSIDELVVNQL